MPEMMVVPFDKRQFFADNNTVRPDKTEGGIEKRVVNEIVASDRRWNFVLDCYAGFGISTAIFAKSAKAVVALEVEPKYASAMWLNLLPYHEDDAIGHVIIIPVDNLTFLKEALQSKQEPPDLIDLDPFGSCDKQLELALRWMQNGALLLTNGQIKSICRDLSWVHKPKYYPDIGNRYVGNKAIDWPKEYYIPRLLKKYPQLRVVHFYVHPTSIRLVCEVGNFEFSKKTIQELRDRPKYLDLFKDMKKDGSRNGRPRAKKS